MLLRTNRKRNNTESGGYKFIPKVVLTGKRLEIFKKINFARTFRRYNYTIITEADISRFFEW
jgi:hypothetical protein